MTEQSHNFHIIVIDDNPDVREDFFKILGTTPSQSKMSALELALFGEEASSDESSYITFQIDSASQGEQGARMVEDALKTGNPYALAFIDMRMPPGWDGIETIKHIWALDQDIQIVICTAYSDYTWEETINELGMRDNLLILKKPFDTISVRQFACALTRKWNLMQDSRKYTSSLETHIQERTQALEQSLSIIHATLESSVDGILVVDESDNIINHNRKFLDMWDITEVVLGRKYSDVIEKNIVNQLITPEEFKFPTKDPHQLTDMKKHNFKLMNGHIYECYVQSCQIEEAKIGFVWTYRDVTEEITVHEKIEHQATHDKLTGLPNRTLLFDLLNKCINDAAGHKTVIGVLFFDLDEFKLINDKFGHKAGDEVLKEYANHIISFIPKSFIFSRFGGDEFIMVLPNLKNEEEISQLLGSLLPQMQSPIKFEEHELNITTSVGVAIYPKDGETAEDLIKAADLAMYKAKESGKNQLQFYVTELHKKSSQRLKDIEDLRRAVGNHEFFCLYQPQFDVKTKRINGIEALIRWQHPERGIVLPLDFLPLAEEIGLIIPIGDWVLRTACQQNKKWQDMGLLPVPISVNIGALQLRQVNFWLNIKEIVTEIKLNPKYLELEVSERTLLDHKQSMLDNISELRKLGIRITLDNFGLGHMSFNSMRNIPLDHLKIDRSFISSIGSHAQDEFIIQSIIPIAKKLNLVVGAQGVETEEQFSFLKEHKCDNVQGIYLSPPLTAVDIEELLRGDIKDVASSL